MTNNERVIAQALAHKGLHAGDKSQRPAWLRLLGPGTWDLDRPFRVVGGKVEGVSTCAVVAIGLSRLAGARAAQAAYRIGAGLMDVIRAASGEEPYGAWFDAKTYPQLRPEPGDVVEQLPRPDNPKGSTHVLTVIAWEGDVLVSIDGGQVADDGLQAIEERRRTWRVVCGVPWLGDKPVHGWLATRLLAFEPE